MHCSVCNSDLGEQTRVEFVDSGKEVLLSICSDCFDDFASDDRLTVARVDD